jgi:hypothetical protein
MTETKTITLELTREQIEFLEWAAKLEGITPEEYLARVAKGKLLKSKERQE